MSQGHALTGATQVEVVAAYSGPQRVIPAVLETPGWYVYGAFFLPLDCDARLDVEGQVSATGNTLRLRLFDMEEAAAVSGSTVQITEEALTRRLSGVVALTGQRTYQIQAECIGASVAEDQYGVVQTATLSQ